VVVSKPEEVAAVDAVAEVATEVAEVATEVAVEEAAPASLLMETTKKSKKDALELKVVNHAEEAVAEVVLVLKEKMVRDVVDRAEAAIETQMLSAEKVMQKLNALKEEAIVNTRNTKENLAKVLTLMTANPELVVARETKANKVVAADSGEIPRTM